MSSPYVPHRPKEGWGHGWEVGLGIVTVVLLILAAVVAWGRFGPYAFA